MVVESGIVAKLVAVVVAVSTACCYTRFGSWLVNWLVVENHFLAVGKEA